ncbi:hypothetical protein JHK87_032442 [Glycine soja]|nr:hypothetical protein JHK87_032442 [Glycine soja]
MGNSHLLGNRGPQLIPCRLQLGRSAAIDVSRRVDEGINEVWTLLYNIKESWWNFFYKHSTKLSLTKYVDSDGNLCMVKLSLDETDVYSNWGDFSFTIQRTGTSSFLQMHPNMVWADFQSIMSMKTNNAVDACGVSTQTVLYLYRRGNRGGLVVTECKRNRGDKEANEVTMAHYFANSDDGKDIGLSVVAKIRAALNGKLDVTVEGPEQHPAFSLLHMFDEVNRTRIWKPAIFSHCAANIRGAREPGNRQNVRIIDNGDGENYMGGPSGCHIEIYEDNRRLVLPDSADILRAHRQRARGIVNGARLMGNDRRSMFLQPEDDDTDDGDGVRFPRCSGNIGVHIAQEHQLFFQPIANPFINRSVIIAQEHRL